jgi:RNA polymerase sigma-70 factor, ECF subfamily
MKKTNENTLMHQLGKGSPEAFAELYRRYNKKVTAYASVLIDSNTLLAEDIAHEVWLKVAKFSPRYQERSLFESWLMKITKNLCFTELMAKRNAKWRLIGQEKLERLAELRETGTLSAAEIALIGHQETLMIQTALKKLPLVFQVVLDAWMNEDNYVSYLSRLMNRTPNAVHHLTFRAKHRLKLILRKEAQELRSKREFALSKPLK